MTWKPNTTVAAVISDGNGRYLFVEEQIDGEVKLNQPAGHLEPNESLVDACMRETLEETGHSVTVDGLIGVYRWPYPSKNKTYMRFSFAATSIHHDKNATLDDGIIGPVWLSKDELKARQTQWRSPMVWQCVEDFENDPIHPLSILKNPVPA